MSSREGPPGAGGAQVVEQQKPRLLQMADAMLLLEAAPHEPFQAAVVTVQDAERVEVPQRDHQVAGSDAGGAPGVRAEHVHEIEVGGIATGRADQAARMGGPDDRIQDGNFLQEVPAPVDDFDLILRNHAAAAVQLPCCSAMVDHVGPVVAVVLAVPARPPVGSHPRHASRVGVALVEVEHDQQVAAWVRRELKTLCAARKRPAQGMFVRVVGLGRDVRRLDLRGPERPGAADRSGTRVLHRQAAPGSGALVEKRPDFSFTPGPGRRVRRRLLGTRRAPPPRPRARRAPPGTALN